jgi:hypothetical protein
MGLLTATHAIPAPAQIKQAPLQDMQAFEPSIRTDTHNTGKWQPRYHMLKYPTQQLDRQGIHSICTKHRFKQCAIGTAVHIPSIQQASASGIQDACARS